MVTNVPSEEILPVVRTEHKCIVDRRGASDWRCDPASPGSSSVTSSCMCPAHLPRDGRNEFIMHYMHRTVLRGLQSQLPVHCWPESASLNPLGLTELPKSGPLLGSRWMLVTVDLFSTTEPLLLLVNSKTYHTEVPWVEGGFQLLLGWWWWYHICLKQS